jgi:glycoside/pentoside/hexuronide:cation symporter, GPH family
MSEQPTPVPASKKVPLSTKLAFGSGGAADNILYNGMNSLVLPIFNVGLGVDAVKLGYAVGLPRILDAIIDPLIGNYSDNLRTRWGRRRPLIFLGVLFAAIFTGILFSPPRSLNVDQLFWWFLGIGVLFYISYAFFMIPYSALGLEITDDYNERTRVLAWRPYMGLAVGLTIPWLYKLCFIIGPNEAEGARTVGWIMGGAALLLGVIPAIFLKERVRSGEHEPMPILRSLAVTFQNRSFLALTGCTLCILLGMFMASPLGLYLTIFYIFEGSKEQAATFGGISGMILLGSGFLGLPFGTWLSSKVGKRHAMLWMLVLAIFFVVLTWFLFIPGQPWPSIVPAFVIGFTLNGCFLIGVSMLGDVCDADELDTGLRREGIYSASMEFGKKVAIGFSTLLSGYLISVTGFDQKLPIQSDDTLLAMRIGYILVIGVTLGLAFLCIWFYPLTHAKTDEVRRLLDIKRG